MWLSVFACASHAPPDPAERGFVPLVDATGAAGPVATPAVGPCPRVEAGLLVATGTVEVVVEVTGAVTWPPSFVETAHTELAVQGALPAADLCALAALEGVVRVRAPWRADPK